MGFPTLSLETRTAMLLDGCSHIPPTPLPPIISIINCLLPPSVHTRSCSFGLNILSSEKFCSFHLGSHYPKAFSFIKLSVSSLFTSKQECKTANGLFFPCIVFQQLALFLHQAMQLMCIFTPELFSIPGSIQCLGACMDMGMGQHQKQILVPFTGGISRLLWYKHKAYFSTEIPGD